MHTVIMRICVYTLKSGSDFSSYGP